MVYAFSGNRILIMGEDINGKTDDLSAILIKAGDTFTRLTGKFQMCSPHSFWRPHHMKMMNIWKKLFLKRIQYHHEHENTALCIFP